MPAAQSTCVYLCQSLSALRQKTHSARKGRLKTDTVEAEAEPLPEAEEIDDSAGSVVIPEGD